MGVPNPFFDPFFDPGIFFLNPRVKKRSLETQLLSKPTFKGKFSICWLQDSFSKTGICSKKMAGIPLCATNLHLHIVIPAFLFLLLKVWKITRGEKMLEVIAVSSVHHVACTPCGVKKVILKPCSYPTIQDKPENKTKSTSNTVILGLLCCIFVAKVLANFVFIC